MKFLQVCLACLGLLIAVSGENANAAFVPVGAPFNINNGAGPGGVLTVGNLQFSNFKVIITGNVPILPTTIIVQAGTEGSQYGLQLRPQNFLAMSNQFLNAVLSFEINSLAPSFLPELNAATMTLTGVSTIGTGLVTIGESLRPTTISAPVGNLSVFAAASIPVEFMHDEATFAPQPTLFVRKDILLTGGSPVFPNIGIAQLGEFFQVYNAVPEPSLAGLAILSCCGAGWIFRRRKDSAPLC